jgi:hypothetical protein
MTETIQFLPWVRGGLGLTLSEREPAALGARDRAAVLAAWVELDGERAAADLSLRPPDHAIAIDSRQITRRYPAPGTPDAEFGYFPHVEFSAPDLPWLLSPTSADEGSRLSDSTGRLRPWVVLVCVEAALASLQPGSPQRLVVPAEELPDLTESWAWAHVQSAAGEDELDAALSGADGLVVSRLICPRRLEPGKQYRVALVNAWAVAGDALVPAWQGGAGTVQLTAYDSWTFSTGMASSFEELCERLGPAPDGAMVLGINPMDMTDLGLIAPWDGVPTPVRVSYTGAMQDTGAKVEELVAGRAMFEKLTLELLNQAATRRKLNRSDPDPVVTPPFYGAFASKATTVPGKGWMAELNLTPRRRAAAGLGAMIVRLHQERFMATAWNQAGQLRETNRLLAQAHLRRSVGDRWKSRIGALDPMQMLSVAGPQLTFVRHDDTTPLLHRLGSGTVPTGMLTPAAQRALRPSGVVHKTLEAPLTRVRPEGAEVQHAQRRHWARQLRNALDTADARAGLDLQQPRAPGGMRGPDPRRSPAQNDGGPVIIPVPRPMPKPIRQLVSLSDSQTTALAAIRPDRTARAQIEARVPALAPRLSQASEGALPSRIRSGPSFTEPLSTTLLALSPALLMPGIADFPTNTVRLVQADPAFAAAFLAGANHEMTRELLWREYPAALDATAFRRFWARPDPAEVDIEPMNAWPVASSLGTLGAAGGESALLLVRGDLLRQYPAARFLLLEPGQSQPIEPSFTGMLPPDVAFFGFDVPDVKLVTAPGSGWIVIIEEPAFEPRFGLDLASDGQRLTTYAELSWDHLVAQTGPHLAIAPETALAADPVLQAEASWGLNSAHMALATFQQPFRRLFLAVDLLGGA